VVVPFIVSGLPVWVTVSFIPYPAPAFSPMLLSFPTRRSSDLYTLTITGVSGTLTRTTSVTLAVNPAPVPDFILSANPASQSVVQGAGTTYAVSITHRGSTPPDFSLQISAYPGVRTASISTNQGTASSTMPVAADA